MVVKTAQTLSPKPQPLDNAEEGTSRRDVTKPSLIQLTVRPSKNSQWTCSISSICCFLMTMVLVTSICIITFLMLQKNKDMDNSIGIEGVRMSIDESVIVEKSEELDEAFKIKSRQFWNAREPSAPMRSFSVTPVKKVVVAHTAGKRCFTNQECAKIIQNIQQFHISMGWSDIAYNFLVGSDGWTYEGRGWDLVGAHTIGHNNDSIGVSLIGDFRYFFPTEDQMEQLNALLDHGVRIGKLSQDYQVFAHCQLMVTNSPGRNVVDMLKSWSRYSLSSANEPGSFKPPFECFVKRPPNSASNYGLDS